MSTEESCVKEFLSNGLLHISGAPMLNAEEVELCLKASHERFSELYLRLMLLTRLYGSHPATGKGTVELVERDGARFDMRYRMNEDPFRRLAEEGPWKHLINRLLGNNAKLMWCGVVIAKCEEEGGGKPQEWHADGEHLFTDIQCPPHCINVFIPLVDVDASNGSTEFLPGSHVLGHQKRADDAASVVKPAVKAGEALFFDYRCVHRGGANTTKADRHVLYLTYAREWFVDKANHRSTVSLFDDACMQAAGGGSTDDAQGAELTVTTEISLPGGSHRLVVPVCGVGAAVRGFCRQHALPPEFEAELEAQVQSAVAAAGDPRSEEGVEGEEEGVPPRAPAAPEALPGPSAAASPPSRKPPASGSKRRADEALE